MERSAFKDVSEHKTVQQNILGKVGIFMKSWHVTINLFSDMPMVYITLWR
jgi:hypothetical protein